VAMADGASAGRVVVVAQDGSGAFSEF